MGQPVDERLALIALSMVPGVGPGRVHAILTSLGSAARAMRAPTHRLAAVRGIGMRTAEAIRAADMTDMAVAQLRAAGRVGAEFVSMSSDTYPALLRQIYNPPPFLWVRGDVGVMQTPCVAIVGTRRATPEGRGIAADLAAQLVAHGVTVVSGMAYGIDEAAHSGALQSDGRSIGVLGSGIDRVYPAAHRGLARRMVRRGAVISEFPLGAKPEAPNFPRRNRIVSGLSLGVVVVQAFSAGGALITAHLANEQNREVFAVPGGWSDRASDGANTLIKRGHAKLIQNVQDILDELAVPTQISDLGDPATVALPDLSDEARQLLRFVGVQPTHIDTICIRAGMDTSTAFSVLLELEFKGVVRQTVGHHFCQIRAAARSTP
jgi:DNA processing protein